MLEVINGFLLLYFVILCSINILLPYLVKPIAACFTRPSGEERTVWSEIMRLKSQLKTLSMKDEFAAYSKLQRQINKLESQLQTNSQTRINKGLAIQNWIQLILRGTVAFLTVVSVFWFRQEPLVVLKGNLFPLTNILKYPSDMPNAISTHVWVVITNVSVRTLLKPIIS